DYMKKIYEENKAQRKNQADLETSNDEEQVSRLMQPGRGAEGGTPRPGTPAQTSKQA
ncbi:uncharacterized, partial [Tachysurus ichikawai]